MRASVVFDSSDLSFGKQQTKFDNQGGKHSAVYHFPNQVSSFILAFTNMASTSLVRKMNLPISYHGPVQTNLECLRLHKRLITRNYKRVMERIFFETKVAPEWPVIVKIFDDRMEFYPLYGRKVPISELRYVDVLSVLPSRGGRKVFVVAIPAKDNTKGIWIIGMRFHPVQRHGGRSAVNQMPSVVAPTMGKMLESDPYKSGVLKEEMTSAFDVNEEVPIEQANMGARCICTSPLKNIDANFHRHLEPVRSRTEENIRTTEIIINRSVDRSPRKLYLESTPENLYDSAYSEDNSPMTVPDDEEFCDEIKLSLDEEYPEEKLFVKTKMHKKNTIKSPKFVKEDTGERSDFYAISRKHAGSTRRFTVKPLKGVRSGSTGRLPLGVLYVAQNKLPKLGKLTSATKLHDGHMEKLVIEEENIPAEAPPGWRLIPGKEVKIFQNGACSRNSGKISERHHETHLQTGRRLIITPLGDESDVLSPAARKLIRNPLLEVQSKEKSLDRNSSFNVRRMMVQLENSVISSTEDSSSESSFGTVERKMATTMSRTEVKCDKDFILTKEVQTDFMFLPERSLRTKRLSLRESGEQVIGYSSRIKIFPLKNGTLSELQYQRSRSEPKYQEGQTVISRGEVLSECESTSTLNITSSEESTNISAELPQVVNMNRKSCSSESTETLVSSSVDSEEDVEALDISSRGRLTKPIDRRSYPRHSVNELTQIEKSLGRNLTEEYEEKKPVRICQCRCHSACSTLENRTCVSGVPFEEYPLLKQISSHRPKSAAMSPPLKSIQMKPSSCVQHGSRPLRMIPVESMKNVAKRSTKTMK
ncbi:hypothetical protein Aperf_G00000032113 [Anoplocephala perfoliata]